ncbi:hypothetical protein HZA55_06975 [Candidatus Poribacteria bacterium]|nr:hypothetical protein [Candidatus Poribacteria bacterium]
MKKLLIYFNIIIVLIIICLVENFNIYAAEFSGNSNTLLILKNNIKQNNDNEKIYKSIEYFDLSVEGKKNYSINLSGWTSGYLTSNREEDDIIKKELTTAYLQYNLSIYPIELKAGRFFINEGIAKKEQIDGVHTRLNFKNNYSLKIYHGLPNEVSELNGRNGDIVYGGQISKAWGSNAEINISYLNETNFSKLFRKEADIYLYYIFYKNAYLVGQVDYNFIKERISAQNYLIKYIANPYLAIIEEFRKKSYEYITPYTTSSLFANMDADVAEELKTYFDINSEGDHSLVIDHQFYNFEQKKNAHYYGAELRYRMLSENTYGFALHRMDASKAFNNYNEVKEFFRIDGDKELFSFEAVQLFYGRPIYNKRQTYNFMFTSGYYFSKNALITGTVDYGINSIFKYNVSGAVKFKYSF